MGWIIMERVAITGIRQPISIPNNTAGVYQITNLLNGKIYIGSSKNIRERFRSHKRELRRGVHCNARLQNSWNKYGEDNFNFSILEICSIEDRFDREQYYIDSTNCCDDSVGYNMTEKVEQPPHTKESRIKQSESLKKNPEFMKYCREQMDRIHNDKEIKKRMIEAVKSSEKVKEIRRKLNESEEHKEQVRILLEQVHSDERIKNIVKTQAQRNIRDEHWRSIHGVKNIVQLTKDFKKVQVFLSLTHPSRVNPEFKRDGITRACRTPSNREYKGFLWMYEEDYEAMLQKQREAQ